MSNGREGPRRAEILRELYEHPDVMQHAWVGELADEDLEMLLSKLGDPEQLAGALDQLQPEPDPEEEL